MREGFSPRANMHPHARDRQGLKRLCRYGARGALALERLSRAEDGRIACRVKRLLLDGTTGAKPRPSSAPLHQPAALNRNRAPRIGLCPRGYARRIRMPKVSSRWTKSAGSRRTWGM
ncbi:transposase [Corallococcus interemptor]|uniref:transposase n=1 Tax=Corallococcus interemptor TaxID=2316720 RepID=UPI003CFCA0F8